MSATIYQGGFATDTIQAGNVMTVTSSGSALVERFDGQNLIDSAMKERSKQQLLAAELVHANQYGHGV